MPEVALDQFFAAQPDPVHDPVTQALRAELHRLRVAFAADAVAITTLGSERARCFLVDGDGAHHGVTAGTTFEATACPMLADEQATVVCDAGRVWIASDARDNVRVAIVVLGAHTDPRIDPAVAVDVARRCAQHLANAPVFDLTVDRASRVQRVLDDELFLIVFQPMVDLRRGTTTALEAFSRFPAEPVRGPRAWFAEAADIGLGVALELAALRHALRYVEDVPLDARVAVNVSAATAQSRGFLDALRTMPLDRLILELDESGSTAHDAVAQALEPLRDAGLLISVPELRDGMIDIGRLVVLRPDIVKLDGSVIDLVDQSSAARATVKSAMTVLRGHDVDACRVVATNVERRAQLDTLALLGVDWGQGYYLGRPSHVRVPRTK